MAEAFKKKFTKEFTEFMTFLKSVNDTDEVINITKNIDHLNITKIAKYMYDTMFVDKLDIFDHNINFLTTPKKYIPTIDLSTYYTQMSAEQVNFFWEKLMRLFVYVEIITGKKQEKNISISSLNEEIKFEDNGTDMMGNIIDMFLDKDKLKEKLQGLNENDFLSYSDQIVKLLSKTNDKNTKDVMDTVIKHLFKELKTLDFTSKSLTENLNDVAKRLAEDFLSGDNNMAKKLVEATKDFISGIKSGESINELTKSMNLNPEEKKIINLTTDFIKNTNMSEENMGDMVSNLMNHISTNGNVDLSSLTKHGITDKKLQEIMSNPKSYGITNQQLANPNRKLKRKAKQQNK